MSASTAKRLSLVDIGWNESCAALFWDKVEKADSCWIWLSYNPKYRYGSFGVNGKIFRVNRLAYAIEHGETPAGLEVCHECDNDRCVRPSHLFLGSRDDNMKDMARKGRSADKCGTLNGRCTVTPEQVLDVVKRAREGGLSQVEIAEAVGTSQAVVNGILTGRLWGHTTGIVRQIAESAEAKEARQREMLRRYEDVSAEQVAEEFGVTVKHIYHLKYSQGMKLKGRAA